MKKFDTVVAADGSKRVFNSEAEFVAYRWSLDADLYNGTVKGDKEVCIVPTPAPRKTFTKVVINPSNPSKLDGFVWGDSAISSPEYLAAQAQRTADMRAALDALNESHKNGFTLEEQKAIEARLNLHGWVKIHSASDAEEKPNNIMAVTRRMCK